MVIKSNDSIAFSKRIWIRIKGKKEQRKSYDDKNDYTDTVYGNWLVKQKRNTDDVCTNTLSAEMNQKERNLKSEKNVQRFVRRCGVLYSIIKYI